MTFVPRALGFFGLGAAVIAFALSFTDREPAKRRPVAATPAITQLSDDDINRALVQYDESAAARAQVGLDPQGGMGGLARSTAAVQAMSDFRAQEEFDRREDAKEAAQTAHTSAWRWRGLGALLFGALAFWVARRRVRAPVAA
jgi:hypothetical protein